MTKTAIDVLNTINEYKMIEKGDSITAALSGGADSVCLLMILCELRTSMELELSAVHINHCIRGEESDSDEKFCISLCRKLGVPLKTYRIDVPAAARTSGRSLEETARDIRYEKFSQCAGENGKIATAHTLSDNAETVLLNFIRGTGLKGLCGIPPVRGNIIRPLIGITREKVEEYLKEKNQEFVTDSTNLSDDYTRNKIRHKIIPVIREINGGFYKSFSNDQRSLREENAFMEELAGKGCEKNFEKRKLSGLREFPPVVRKRIVSRFLGANDLPVSFEKINEVDSLADKDGKVNIAKDIFIDGRGGVISIQKKISEISDIEIPLKIGKNRIFENSILIALENKSGKYHIDMDKVSGKIIVRNRRFGDKIRLSGRNFTSSVKKLINEKVPRDRRPFIHFLSDEEGLIFMEGFGVADRVRADENSERILSVSIENTDRKNE
ncbi:MAG: tRNA lysidine(34) synthetase TilS [Porcipelethomonas sp.]